MMFDTLSVEVETQNICNVEYVLVNKDIIANENLIVSFVQRKILVSCS